MPIFKAQTQRFLKAHLVCHGTALLSLRSGKAINSAALTQKVGSDANASLEASDSLALQNGTQRTRRAGIAFNTPKDKHDYGFCNYCGPTGLEFGF